jgi:hypothetical protein
VADLDLRYEHLSPYPRNTPARRERRRKLAEHIEEIWAEQEAENVPVRLGIGLGLPLAPRYLRKRKDGD